MITKMQPVQERAILKGITKKIMCPQHNLSYVFKCQYPTCDSPFICSSIQCIENHLHEEKITMTQFKSQSLSNKFYQVESMISDDTMNDNARVLKSYIEGLKDSIKHIYMGIKTINQNYDFLKGDIDGPLNPDYIKKVQENYELNRAVRKNLDQLKDKVKVEFPIKDSYFTYRSYLIQFLAENIPHFSWSKSKQIYSSKNELTTTEKFHEKLCGKKHLLYLFIGESRIIGSYYTTQYPSLLEKHGNDSESFLFINSSNDPTKFLKFIPKPDSSQHIIVSERNYISHGNTPSIGDGIRTFHRNFQTLEFSLPSLTFESIDNITQTISGKMKVNKFMILQIEQEKDELANGSIDELE